MTDRPTAAITIAELDDYFATLEMDIPRVRIEAVAQDWAQARIPIANVATRPGGYVPGPVMMGAVDFVGWVLVFTRIGISPMSLTWDLKMNFLRPAANADVIVEGTQHKFGRLCHSSMNLYLEADPSRLVAHATTTYVVPE